MPSSRRVHFVWSRIALTPERLPRGQVERFDHFVTFLTGKLVDAVANNDRRGMSDPQIHLPNRFKTLGPSTRFPESRHNPVACRAAPLRPVGRIADCRLQNAECGEQNLATHTYSDLSTARMGKPTAAATASTDAAKPTIRTPGNRRPQESSGQWPPRSARAGAMATIAASVPENNPARSKKIFSDKTRTAKCRG